MFSSSICFKYIYGVRNQSGSLRLSITNYNTVRQPSPSQTNHGSELESDSEFDCAVPFFRLFRSRNNAVRYSFLIHFNCDERLCRLWTLFLAIYTRLGYVAKSCSQKRFLILNSLEPLHIDVSGDLVNVVYFYNYFLLTQFNSAMPLKCKEIICLQL